MIRTFKATVAVVMLAVGFAGSVAAAPLEDAVTASEKGDYATALRLIRTLAEKGDANAQYNLGVMYDRGLGVPPDYAAAASWYRKAAEKGDTNAQYNLGVMYDTGHGVPQDYVAALIWLGKAAEKRDADAQYNLGVIYRDGHGVPQDYVTALMWFNLAAVTGNKDTVENRDFVAAKMTPAQISEAQKLAREWKPATALR